MFEGLQLKNQYISEKNKIAFVGLILSLISYKK